MTLRALVTRPEEDAAPLAAALAKRGIDVAVEPLLTVEPIAEAVIDLSGVQALLFTSANGVRAFARLAAAQSLAGWRDLPAFAVGDATAATARDAGFARVESAAGDVAALAGLAGDRLDPAAGLLFHAAGSAVAGDLAGLLADRGFTLRRTMIYSSKPAEQLSPTTVTALANGAYDLVLFFSPRTAATFVALARDAGAGVVAGCASATALCLSPAVAAAARELPWRTVESAARPELPALLDLVDRRLADAAKPTTELPMPETPAGAAPKIRHLDAASSRGRLLPAALVAAVVALVVALGAAATQSWWAGDTGDGAPIAVIDPALAGRLDAAEAKLAELSARIDEANDPAAADARLAPLADEIDALKQQIAGLPAIAPGGPAPDLQPLNRRLATLERQLADLAARPTDGAAAAAPAADSAALAQLESENAALRAELAELKSRVGSLDGLGNRLDALEQTVAQQGRKDGEGAFALAVGGLGAALATPQSFAAELTALEGVAAADPVLAVEVAPHAAALAAGAANGIPTLAELRARFPGVARAVADVAAQQKLVETLGTPEEADSWINRTLRRLTSIGTIRPTGEIPGDDPTARVARAELRLAAGDLAAAADELTGLSGGSAAAAAEWLAGARARLAADQALSALQAMARQRFAAGAAAGGG